MDTPDLVPARILNEFAYCPRLAYLEWVQGEFSDSADTVEGRFRHRAVDREGGDLPAPSPAAAGGGKQQRPDGRTTNAPAATDRGDQAPPEDQPDAIHARSVLLSSEPLGLIARIDLVEGDGTRVTPVDYKRGHVPDLPEGAWEPERVQVCAQALVLRDNGYTCDEGVIYYVESKRRVPIAITETLVARTRELLAQLRETAASGQIPPPLVNSPKCPRCSLAPICLPDEVTALQAPDAVGDVRRIFPARDDAVPLYLQAQGMTVGISGEVLQVKEHGKPVREARLLDTSQVCVIGNIQVTTQAVRELASRSVPVCYFSYGGWFQAMTVGMAHKNIELRRLQYAAATDPVRSLAFARAFVAGKVRNQRTLLRRNHIAEPTAALAEMSRMADTATRAAEMDSLLGMEGAAARTYFSHFRGMLNPAYAEAETFDFTTRNRRPPTDPVNALLSFLYSMLAKDAAVTLFAVGFDPFLGFYHQPRYGRPALALDLMEEFRSLIADSTVLTLVNKREVVARDFVRRGPAVMMSESGRKAVIRAYERRMDDLVTHPTFGYQVSYRRVLEIQARLLGRALAGEIPAYPPFTTR